MRLKTKLWIDAQIRSGFLTDMPTFVLAKGDAERGGILLKVNRFEGGVFLYEAGYSFEGERVWRAYGEGGMDEALADQTIAKKRSYDSDLWVLEIEDRQRGFILDAPLETL